MSDTAKHPPASTSATGQPLPRRTSPENSVTLLHHRVVANARGESGDSTRAGSTMSNAVPLSLPRRNSSDDSNDTGHSDPKEWFQDSNEHPSASFSQAADADPPFFQKETDSSNEDIPKSRPFPYHQGAPISAALKPSITHSSSSDDYRSVIDDLTIEIQRLKGELKRYKQLGPEMLKREKLFEIKVHGLPSWKKRELETKLRDFAANLETSPSAGASSARQHSPRHMSRLHSGSRSMSKHASSSSGSNSRPADSAYASMSTGANSSGPSLGGPSLSSRARSSEHKVENYLKEIPEGLYPRHVVISEKEKKRMVVRRLEQLFTGTNTGPSFKSNQSTAPPGNAPGLVAVETQSGNVMISHRPPRFLPEEWAREARIHVPRGSGKKSHSRDNTSNSQSNGDRAEAVANTGGSNSTESNTSPPTAPPPEQRATKPRDLDPDRIQIPSENMEYIRHLGLVPPELVANSKKTTGDASPDAEGWVYLNLLCNLAQLHIMNVTPDFIREAVSQKSTKFQLSSDGRKIRWRGGTDGTKFVSSDTSGGNSSRSPSNDDTDASRKSSPRKRVKTQQSSTELVSSMSSNNRWMPQMSVPLNNFHYKPLLVTASSSIETSVDNSGSSPDAAEESRLGGDSREGLSRSSTSQRRKRRLDGAIIYYNGAPFCTDLSGDAGDLSPATYMTTTRSGQQRPSSTEFARPDPPFRTISGSSLPFRPLSETNLASDTLRDQPQSVWSQAGEGEDIEGRFPWSNSSCSTRITVLESCGLGGVRPEDHFAVSVTTKRPKELDERFEPSQVQRSLVEDSVDTMIRRVTSASALMHGEPTSVPPPRATSLKVQIEYISGRIKRLPPVPLPPPAMFFPPFSSDSSEDSTADFPSDADDEGLPPSDIYVRRNNVQGLNNLPFREGLSMALKELQRDDSDDMDDNEDEFDELGDIEMRVPRNGFRRSSSSAIAAAGTATGRSKSPSADPIPPRPASSVATAGDRYAESGYSSSVDEAG